MHQKRTQASGGFGHRPPHGLLITYVLSVCNDSFDLRIILFHELNIVPAVDPSSRPPHPWSMIIFFTTGLMDPIALAEAKGTINNFEQEDSLLKMATTCPAGIHAV